MRELVRTGMREGAFGLSTGLFYVPGNYAPLEEVVELARVAGALRRHPQSHMRDEAARVLDSVRETIAIGERGGLPTQVTHHKIIGKANWGRSVETLRSSTRRAPAAWTQRSISIPTPHRARHPGRPGAAMGAGRRPRRLLERLKGRDSAARC